MLFFTLFLICDRWKKCSDLLIAKCRAYFTQKRNWQTAFRHTCSWEWFRPAGSNLHGIVVHPGPSIVFVHPRHLHLYNDLRSLHEIDIQRKLEFRYGMSMPTCCHMICACTRVGSGDNMSTCWKWCQKIIFQNCKNKTEIKHHSRD